MDDTEFKSYLKDVAKARGADPSIYDRFKSDFIRSDGLKLRVEVIETDRSKPVVVFIPGTSVYALLYGEFLAALADKGYNVVGFDPRGHGRSEGARGSYTIAELVRDTHAAVEYARNRFGGKIIVAGSSQGGIAAFYYAARNEPIAGAICHNAADLGDPSSVELTRAPNFSRAMKPFLKFFASFMPELKIPVAMYLDLEKEEMKGFGNAKAFLDKDPLALSSIRLKALASLAFEKLPRPVEEIKTPVQILHAGLDNIFPLAYIQRIFNRLTCKKELKVYPNYQHLILTEHVDDVMPDVVKWIEEICRI